MRCSNCGNESQFIDEYICSNCGVIIQTEFTDRIPFLKRIEDTWYSPEKPFKRILKVITKPNKAFWDIRNSKYDKGPLLIKLLLALSLGLMGVAISSHVNYVNSTPWISLGFFIQFFLFGLIYYFILLKFFNFVFSLAANFSVQFDEVLRVRYNVFTSGFRMVDMLSGQALRKKMEQEKRGLVISEISEEDMLTKIKHTGKGNMMNYAYAPLVLVNLIGALIALVGLPSQSTSSGDLQSAILSISSSGVWKAKDILILLTVMIWIPITMSLAMRELGNCNTTRLIIGNLIAGILLSYAIYFLRPTVGINFNFITGNT